MCVLLLAVSPAVVDPVFILHDTGFISLTEQSKTTSVMYRGVLMKDSQCGLLCLACSQETYVSFLNHKKA